MCNFAGALGRRELKAAMRALGFQVKKVEITRMMQDCDIDTQDDGGQATLEEFVEMASSRMVRLDG